MSACILYLARVADAALWPELTRRTAWLERFYAPLGARPLPAQLGLPPLVRCGGWTVDSLDGEPASGEQRSSLAWGAMEGRRGAPALLGASAEALLELADGGGLLLAASREGARLLTGEGVTAGYRAEGPGVRAWASHAVAAAVLATGGAEVDETVLAELVASEYVGGGRTLVRGVRAMPPAAIVHIGAAGEVRELRLRGERERYAPMHPVDARRAAEVALDARLASTAGDGRWLSLSGGLDSLVLATRAAVLGGPVRALTWGGEDDPDARRAQEVARALGLEHHVLLPEALDAGARGPLADAECRWTDGARPSATFARPPWVEGVRTLVTGAGGETGRAWYYGLVARSRVRVTEAVLRRVLDFTPRVSDADPEALATLRAHTGEWIDAALETGHRGWAVLDVLYAQQRLRHWGRSHVPRVRATTVPGFGGVELQQALASLPLADKLTSAFHRRVVAATHPALVPPPGPTQRRGIPPPLRRLAAARRAPPPPAPFPYAAQWSSAERAFLEDVVLSHPLVHAGLGDRWADRVRGGFRRDEQAATLDLLRIAGPVRLALALAAAAR